MGVNPDQIISRVTLTEIANNTTGTALDKLLLAIDKETSDPFRMILTASRVVTVQNSTLVNPETSRNRMAFPIASANAGYYNFTSATVTIPTSNNNPVVLSPSGGTAVTINITASNFIRVGVAIDASGVLQTAVGTQASSAAAATLPSYTSGQYPIGHILVQNVAGTLQVLTNASIFQYTGTLAVGGGDVVGPASATDLSLAIFDGTTGKLLKNSSSSATQLLSGGLTVTLSAGVGVAVNAAASQSSNVFAVTGASSQSSSNIFTTAGASASADIIAINSAGSGTQTGAFLSTTLNTGATLSTAPMIKLINSGGTLNADFLTATNGTANITNINKDGVVGTQRAFTGAGTLFIGTGYGTGAVPLVQIRSARGTIASSTALATTDNLGRIQWSGGDGAGTFGIGAYIEVFNPNAGSWTTSLHDSQMDFYTTSGTTLSRALSLGANGAAIIGASGNTSTHTINGGVAVTLAAANKIAVTGASSQSADMLTFTGGSAQTGNFWSATDSTGIANVTLLTSGGIFNNSRVASGGSHFIGTTYGVQGGLVRLVQAAGTIASPTATQSGSLLGTFAFGGHTGSAFTSQTVAIKATATANWTGSVQTTKLTFETTTGNSTSECLALSGAGVASIGLTSGTFAGNNIYGVNDGSSPVAGTMGERVVSSVSTLTNFPTTTQYGDLTSISLTAGEWDVSATITSNLNSSTATDNALAISTTAGNSSSGFVTGDNFLEFVTPTAATNSSCSIPVHRIAVSATTTVYLKYRATYSAGNPRAAGRISARRVR